MPLLLCNPAFSPLSHPSLLLHSPPLLLHHRGFPAANNPRPRPVPPPRFRLPAPASSQTPPPPPSPLSPDDPTKKQSIQLYGQIERVFTDTAMKMQGSFGNSGSWQEIQGAWVIGPTGKKPFAKIHFTGGVFVGAAPQLTYRLFLERLAERGFLVIATPFASGFDHLRIADEAQFKFDRCIKAMEDFSIESLPTFGIGHSLGALIQLLIGARYAVRRVGNVFLSFNNKEASLAVPLFTPVIVPMAQNMGPILRQVIASPTVRLGTEMAMRNLQNISPPLVKQLLPLVEQLPPLYMDLADGKDRFTPPPDETRRLVRLYYGVGRNLLVKFKDDEIDETPVLAQILSCESAISSYLDMSVRTLPGDHTRPLQQVLPEVPSGMADAVTRGSELLATLAEGTPWASVAKDVGQTLGADVTTVRARQLVIQDIEALVDELEDWIMSSL